MAMEDMKADDMAGAPEDQLEEEGEQEVDQKATAAFGTGKSNLRSRSGTLGDKVLASLDQAPSSLILGWPGTLCWTGFITVWYLLMQRTIGTLVSSSDEARSQLLENVPVAVYYYSEAAFMVSTVLNLLNMVFEDSPARRQLACLSAVIKGLSWHCDHLITSGAAVIKYDYHGVIILPSRYVQWSCSTPTIIFAMSRISSLAPAEVATTMLADWLMVVTGYVACELPWVLAVIPTTVSFLCFIFVIRQLWRMLHDALREADSVHARRCLWFTLVITMVVWNLFWIAWVVGHSGVPVLVLLQEPLTIFANFAAKVVFSTTVVYNNFVTLAERRRAAQLATEHKERIQAVQELTAAVSRKDAFLEVVAHELGTPLNAIVQLSGAMTVGAGGPLGAVAREWLLTIKASASHLLGVVNDILTFRASKATSMQLNQELVNMGEVVDEVIRQLIPGAGPNVTLAKAVHGRLPLIVADRRRVVLALSNLVSNAIKFMDKACGKITVKAYPDRGARHVVIKVVDNGPGLTPAQLAQLINTSTMQIDPSKRRAGGLGLGIPITHQLIGAHGGVVWFSSPGQGKGTTALIRLPVLQHVTSTSLRNDFMAIYTSLGYNFDQLIDPELATAEGRTCPTFAASPDLLFTTTATQLDAGIKQAHRASGTQPAVQPMYVPAMQSKAAPTSHHHVGPPPSGSANSSMEMGSSPVLHTFKWTPPTHPEHSAHRASDELPDTATIMGARPSEESLAAWEAYAENMGYVLPGGEPTVTTPRAGAGAPGDVLALDSDASNSSTTAAGMSMGVPGQAVALMSSLYGPSTVTAKGATTGKSASKSRLG